MNKPSKKEDLTRDEAIENLKSLSRRYETLQQEFETFAYIVSHDLQAPLRGVVSFSELLLDRYGDHFDEKGTKHFGYVINGSRQMQEMVQGLLAYSRLSTQEPLLAAENLEKLIKVAQQENREYIAASKAIINLPDSLPDVICDRKQMTRVFTELLDNALKFQPEGQTPEIRIEIEKRADDYLVSVQDNGIGIPPDKCEEVFNVFRRLNRHDEYAGIGMGLTLAKKIIEGHGGEIFIKAESDKGSSVYFSIKKS